MRKTLLIPSGRVFFYDPSHPNPVVPEHTESSVVAANASCISVHTLPDVDGEVFIELSYNISEEEKRKYHRVFDGIIETPGRQVTMMTREEVDVLEVKSYGASAYVSVWVDNHYSPTILLAEVGKVVA